MVQDETSEGVVSVLETARGTKSNWNSVYPCMNFIQDYASSYCCLIILGVFTLYVCQSIIVAILRSVVYILQLQQVREVR